MAPKCSAEVNGSTTQAGSFNGAFHGLAVDQSNGHFYLADIGSETEGHKVVDEFDSGGELVSELHTPPALKDANPTGIAVDNSGGENDGDLFFSAGQNPSSVFAYGPLSPPTHPELPALGQSGFSRVCGLAVDSAGNRYVSEFTAKEVRVYSPSGTQITSFATSVNTASPCGLAVDSQGNVYVNGRNKDVVKYKPSVFPPTGSTTYEADTSLNTTGVLVAEGARGVAVDPATDDVYVAFESHISSYQPDGTPISETIGEGVGAGFSSVAVRGSTGKVYAYGGASAKAYVLSPDGSEVLAEVNGSTTQAGSFNGAFLGLAVDQSNGHFYLADIGSETEGHKVVDEFDSGGELVSELHTPPALKDANPTGIAVDNSGGENDGDLFFSAGQNPSSVFAYGPLSYAEFFELKALKSGPGAGTVTSSPAGVNCGTTCTVAFEKGSSVTLTAVASTGSKFSSWTGCDTVVANECTVTMSEKRKVTAKFNTKPTIESEDVVPRDTSARLQAEIVSNGEETSYQFESSARTPTRQTAKASRGPKKPSRRPLRPKRSATATKALR